MNALADAGVADFLNDHCVATYMKVGTFRIVNGQKVGGNVASYFCRPDGAVLHAVPGKVDAATLLTEARWAVETHKTVLTFSTNFVLGTIDAQKAKARVRRAHEERYLAEARPELRDPRQRNRVNVVLSRTLPTHVSQQGQAHWLLATDPLPPLEQVYPIIWERILNERLYGLPVAKK